MRHDPLCTAMHKNLISPLVCSRCELLKKARLDERVRCITAIIAVPNADSLYGASRLVLDAYLAGLSDAQQAIQDLEDAQ